MSAARDALQMQVERIRTALLERHGFAPGMELPRDIARSPLDDVQRLATVSAHWGIASDLPIVGRFLVLFRRVQRILLRWYINPIVDQQNAFNDAVVRALHELETENEKLRTQLADRSRLDVPTQ
ncbi:MAG TPA: hypothetical protein VFV93_16545 [Thermomicrobiales bacterium]|nr:hypothetical protein [Thermomicrobiales bacterium]